MKHFSYSWERSWLALKPGITLALSPALIPWFTERDSMTERMRQKAQSLTLRLLCHRWGRMTRSEALRLRLDAKAPVLVRCVELSCNGKPWILGRSVIPRTTLTGSERVLRHWGALPIGEYIFKHRDLYRSDFECSRLPQNHIAKICSNYDCKLSEVWTRRSMIVLSGKPLLLTEAFVAEEWYE